MCLFRCQGGRMASPRAALGDCGARGHLWTPGSLSVPGTLLWASALGRFIFFLPQPAKGTLSPHPGGLRAYKDLASCWSLHPGIPWKNKKKSCIPQTLIRRGRVCLSLVAREDYAGTWERSKRSELRLVTIVHQHLGHQRQQYAS